MNDRRPLLTIFIPTFNRSHFLRVMLQALLPQVDKCGGAVEVCVLDNASSDDTPRVIDESRMLGQFRYFRNSENLGPLKNIIKGPIECASGKYVWGLGDHNLLSADGLEHIVATLQERPSFDLFYVNFRCSNYPEQWPQSALGGYDGPYSYLGNAETTDYAVREWHEFVRPENALCTQLYAHIVNREIWIKYWANRRVGECYTNGETTYPHTWMLTKQAFRKPVFYIGKPILTIFNGAQSWGQAHTQIKVYLFGLTDLLMSFGKAGISKQRTREIQDGFIRPQTQRVLVDAFDKTGVFPFSAILIKASIFHPHLLSIIIVSFVDSKCNTFSRFLNRVRESLRNRKSWWMYNNRPARWYRSFQNSDSVK